MKKVSNTESELKKGVVFYVSMEARDESNNLLGFLMLTVLYLHIFTGSAASKHFFRFTISISIASKVRGNPSSFICALCLNENCGLSNLMIIEIYLLNKNLTLVTNVDI